MEKTNKQKQLQKMTGFPTQRNPLFLVVPEHNTGQAIRPGPITERKLEKIQDFCPGTEISTFQVY